MDTIRVQNISLYESFLAVAQKGNFSLATTQLGLNKSQISKRVIELENVLNARLFNRTTRKVTLTSEGLELLPRVEKIIEQMKEIEIGSQREKKISGTIRITTLHSFLHSCLSDILVRFSAKYPEVNFDILVGDRVVDMIEDRIDVSFRVQKPKGADFVFRKILDNKMIFCASPKYLKSLKKVPKSIDDIEKLPLITLKVFDDLILQSSGRTLGSLKSPRPINCDTGHAVTTLALKGAGIAVRSWWDVAEHIQKKELTRICPQIKIQDFRALYCVTSHSKFLPERTQAFIKFLQQELKNYPLDLSLDR
jgi:LysR family transcriptional activator of dmlA